MHVCILSTLLYTKLGPTNLKTKGHKYYAIREYSVLHVRHPFSHIALFCSKFPELFNSFKTLLGFKDPGLPEQLPTASPTPLYPPKERVTEFAAEIGKMCMLVVLVCLKEKEGSWMQHYQARCSAH